MASVSKRIRKHLDPLCVELAHLACEARRRRETEDAERTRERLLQLARAYARGKAGSTHDLPGDLPEDCEVSVTMRFTNEAKGGPNGK